ncbi:complex I NDUFA9 subunit family protein [Malonomonas rubra]|uniref:complex I NDUFA9 subunit family protein n=1 Tax=Malonomonas rubra TaxID=57040 RepID=UPI0026EC1BA2|nr:complex I NDUFA9 subunit family protein [Malonomonas rubra]
MKILLTGATGFVGQEVLRTLLKVNHEVRALIHNQSKIKQVTGAEVHIGDTTRPESLTEALAGCDAVIHLVGIIREYPHRGITFQKLHTESTRNMLETAKDQGVTRFLHMSANGTRADAVTNYHKTKWAAEQLVRQSGLDWTIFRPSLIYGPSDQFINMLAALIRKLPVVPVIGDGKYRLQPVSVKDVATGFVRALDCPESIGQAYHCGGPQVYSYDELLDLVGVAMGKKKVYKLHQPLAMMKPVVALLQSIPQFPMTSDQLQMLLEENICEQGDWEKTFAIKLQKLPEGISEYVN